MDLQMASASSGGSHCHKSGLDEQRDTGHADERKME
jgi:hypothetical protein